MGGFDFEIKDPKKAFINYQKMVRYMSYLKYLKKKIGILLLMIILM